MVEFKLNVPDNFVGKVNITIDCGEPKPPPREEKIKIALKKKDSTISTFTQSRYRDPVTGRFEANPKT